jgi:hypothetical protein
VLFPTLERCVLKTVCRLLCSDTLSQQLRCVWRRADGFSLRICLRAGEEEVPPGVVGVIVLGDCPDVLSHCAVRARNCKIPVVACPRCVCPLSFACSSTHLLTLRYWTCSRMPMHALRLAQCTPCKVEAG